VDCVNLEASREGEDGTHDACHAGESVMQKRDQPATISLEATRLCLCKERVQLLWCMVFFQSLAKVWTFVCLGQKCLDRSGMYGMTSDMFKVLRAKMRFLDEHGSGVLKEGKVMKRSRESRAYDTNRSGG